jgi:tRNA threonylcarbamoyladenosine biosynthesis protein TsaE
MSAGPLVLEAADIAETEAIGRRLGERLFPGAVVGLIGPLGAGKTCLVRSIVAGLGGDPRQVSSPTFALIHEYAGRLPVYHFDTYRLPNEKAFADLGVDEYFAGDGVCLIEWADRVTATLPPEHLLITIEPTSETSRRIQLDAVGECYLPLVSPADEP